MCLTKWDVNKWFGVQKGMYLPMTIRDIKVSVLGCRD